MLTKIILNSLLILSLLTIIITPQIIKARERKRIHDSLSKALEKGLVPPPELLKALTDATRPPKAGSSIAQRDLRAGVIWLSVSIGIGALGVALVFGHDPRYIYLPIREPLAALGIAAFPAAVGIGYLILWLTERNTLD